MAKLVLLFLFLVSSAHAETISYIGDSQSASTIGLFSRLNPAIRRAGHSFSSGRAVCGATIQNYLTGGANGVCRYPGVTSMNIQNGSISYPSGSGTTLRLASILPSSDVVIVQLGDNHLSNPNSAGVNAERMAREILSAGKRCIWIGPAAVGGNCTERRGQKAAVGESIRRALENLNVNGRQCQYINSFRATAASPPNSRDCLHYTNYQPWASAIESQVLTAVATRENPLRRIRASGVVR